MRKHTILLIDDNRACCRSLELALNALGFNVLAVHNPIEAIEAARQNIIHILITDFDMRVSRGDELALQLSQLQSIPRNIIMSTRELNVDHLKFPFDLTIRKPIQLESLEEVLTGWSMERKTSSIEEI